MPTPKIATLPSWASHTIGDYFFWRARCESLHNQIGVANAALPFDPISSNKWARAAFAEYVMFRHPRQAHEDVGEIARTVWDTILCRGPIYSLRKLLEIHNIQFEIDLGEVTVPTRYAAVWGELTALIDPEALLVTWYVTDHSRYQGTPFHFAHGDGHSMPPMQDRKWGVVPRVSDLDLDLELRNGLTDRHVHFGGLRNAHLLWVRLLLGELRIETLPPFFSRARRHPEKATSGKGWLSTKRALVSSVVSALRNDWHKNAIPEPRGRAGATVFNLNPEHDFWRLNEAVLAARRHLLTICQPPGGSADDTSNLWAAQREFDAYVTSKSLFMQEFQQSQEATPGLAAFRRYYAAGKPKIANVRSPPDRSASLIARSEHTDIAYYLSQSCPWLKHVELRLEPTNDVHAMVRFFKAWEIIETKIFKTHLNCKITFALHFKRTEPREDTTNRGNRAGTLPYRVLTQAEYDSQAYAIHRFRNSRSCAAWASRITRIDLAGQERDATPDIAAFQMRLLREDPDAIRALDGPVPCHAIAHRRWLWLHQCGQLLSRGTVPRLRLTCHAGEDNCHPLEGLYAMDSARVGLRLAPGDTVGHGLAAGWDIALFHKRHGRSRLISKGRLFDMYVWLRSVANRLPDVQDLALHLNQIDDALRALFADLYETLGGSAAMPAPERFPDLATARCGPVPSHEDPGSDPVRKIVYSETWHEGTASKRAQLVALETQLTRLENLAPLIISAQRKVLDDLANTGIAIEINPSSNYRVSGATTLSEIPYVGLLSKMANTVLATVSTDDPGIFGTRIENEYALILSSLREAQVTRQDALIILQRLQHLAQRYTNR